MKLSLKKEEEAWNQESLEDVENSEEVITAPSREEMKISLANEMLKADFDNLCLALKL